MDVGLKIWCNLLDKRAKGLRRYAWMVWQGLEPQHTHYIEACSLKEAKAIAKEQKQKQFGKAGRLCVWYIETI